MKEYRVLATYRHISGAIKLTPEQVETRKRFLEKTKKTGEYITLSPIVFKAGEVIGLAFAEKGSENYLQEVKGKK